MNDRELIELAAKAAGIKPLGESFELNGDFAGFCMPARKVWNPLDINTGDALRLAVKLGIGISTYYFDGEYFVKCGSWRSDVAFTEPLKEDSYSATCRAIVRAAAEIGRKLK